MTDPLEKYPDDTAEIVYVLNGEQTVWYIGATADDDEASLRAHLQKWIPNAEFISSRIKPRIRHCQLQTRHAKR